MSFIPYPPSIYNLDYDRVKELNNKLYSQRLDFRKISDKLNAARIHVKQVTKDITTINSLKHMSEYEIAITVAYNNLFEIETLVRKEILQFYIDTLYASPSLHGASSSSS